MKKLSAVLVLACGLMVSGRAVAQKVKSSAVPPAVVAALKAKYPAASSITWEKEKANFEANWGGKSGEDMSVVFTPAGALVEQVEAIAPSSLPSAALTYIKAHYSGAKPKEAGKVTDAAGKVTLEAELKGKAIVFDEKGNFVKEEKEND